MTPTAAILLEVELPRREYQRLCRREGLEPSALSA